MKQDRNKNVSGATREKALKAAAKVFAKKGYDGARVDEIAAQAGLNKASLYYHVGGKEALYAATLQKFFSAMVADLAAVVESSAPVTDRLALFVATITRNIAASDFINPVILRELAAGVGAMPVEIRQVIGQVTALEKQLLDEGERLGVFRPVDLNIVHFTIVGGVNFYLAAHDALRTGVTGAPPIESPEEIGRRIADLILSGVTLCSDQGK